MPSDRTSFRPTFARALRQALPWVLALAVATCADDQNGPSHGGRGYFAFRPVYGINGSLNQFGIVADSVHIRLTRPVNQVVLDTTVFFPADSSKLRLALPVALLQSPETLTAVIGISAGPTLLFTDSLDVAVVDGPPSVATIPTVVLTYVGPGRNVAAITLLPGDTTVLLRDTLFFSATAVDSAAQPVASFFVGWKTSDTTVARINGAGRLIAPNLRGSVKVIGTTPTGILDTTTVTFAPVPVLITADSGNAQTGVVADSLGANFVARVKASDSLGVPGIAVRWTAVTAGGRVRDTVLLTDANGRVRTRGVFGDTVRVYSYTAAVVGRPLSTTFTATATAAAASAIALQSGNLQTDSAGRVLAAPFVARVTDAYGNVVSGAKVYWTRTAGTGTVANDSVLTNASGLASTAFTLGAVGNDTVTAALAGTSATVRYAATAINGAPATATKVFGDTQTAVVNTRLTDSLAVVVKSATAYPVVGAPVVWTVVRGGLAAPDTAFTDVNGRAAIAYTLGTASGSDTVRAQAGTITALFTATAKAAAPSAIGILSGNAQVDTAHRTLPLPLVVAVTDTFGNPVTGAPVTFVRIAGHGTPAADTVTSLADNHPSTGYTLGAFPGTDSVRVTLLANGKFVTFTATAVNATPSALVTSVGSGQTATVGTAFTDSLVAQVLDANSLPIAGEAVIFAVTSGTATLTADTVLTDSLGRAVTHATGGNTAGAVQVTAHVATPITPASFTLTLTAGSPTAFTAITGDLQTDTAGTALPLPFSVTVVDAFGNPVAGARVAFTRLAGHGTAALDTVTATAAGVASDGYTLGTLPGTDTVRAALVGGAAVHAFTATAVPATPASLVATAGNNQAGVVTTALALPLQARVYGAGSVPIAGATLVWTVIRGGTLSVDTVVSDSLGFSQAGYTLGANAGTDTVQVATLGGALTARFTETANADVASAIAIVSGSGQTDTTGHVLPLPLVVHVTDVHGNAVAGAKIGWATLSGAGTPVTDTTFTDASGAASTTYKLGTVPGTDTVRAALAGTSAFVRFTAATVSGAPAGLVKVFGDAQIDTVKSTLVDSLIVQLKDGSGTNIPNAWLYWQTAGLALSADSTRTDANGRAAVQATFGTAAAALVVAVRNVDTTVAAVFNLRAKAGKPSQLTVAGGNAQTGTINTALALPFRVIAQDAYGNPADSARVAFTRLVGSGVAAPDTALSDTLGLATSQYTLGATAGIDSVRAQLVGAPANVLFTATTTAGAVSSLVYVSGTGQSDTISATLPAPFTVQARDAGNNPVAGLWVHFARIHGTGTLLADSALTDAAGAASSGYTLGTVVGLDSVTATLAGTPDTIRFYAATTVGAPKILAIVSGDSQSAAISATLAAPFAVRITDRSANPIAGASVTFDTTATGGSIAAATTVTNATGLATSGGVTLGAAAGTISFIAITPVLPADTARFTAIALPLGTSSQWTGTLSSNWGTAGNWSPAAVPASSDNVFIPAAAPNQPVLDVARTVGGLQVETGASVTLGANSLTTVGNTQVDGTISRTSGLLILNASAGTARGHLAGVRVTGNVTLAGAATVADSLQLTSGSLVVNGQVLTINGAFSDNGTGALTMQNPADSVTVTGATLYNGSATAGLLTAGTLVLQGPFSEPTGGAVFQGSGTHTTVFNGGSNQTVTFASAALAGNRFQNVVFANPSGITLGGNLAANGTTSVTAGVVTGPGRTAFLGGSLSDPTSLGWNVATTSLAGAPTLLPDSILGNLDLTGTVTLAKPIVVKGNLTPNASGVLNLNGFRMRVDGGLTVSGTAQVVMQNAADSLDVAGAISWNGSTAAGLLSAGTFVVRGNFSEPSGAAVFQGSGTHTTVFAGAAAQTVAFGSASLVGNRFQNVAFANPAGVTLTANAAAGGNGAVTAGTVTGSTASTTITVGGNVTDPTSSSWQVPITVLAGTPTALPDSFPAGVTVTGTVTLAKPLVIKGAYSQSSGTVTLNGSRLRADSTFAITGTASVLMQNPADTLDIGGTVSWNGSTSLGQLTAGTLILRGNFSEPSGATVFSATGTHRTVFAGTAAQAVSFGAQGLAGNHFQDLVVSNAAGVNFANGGSVAGNASIAGGVITSSAGQVLTVNGNLTDPTNVSWRPEVTSLTGTPTVLPDSFTRNVTVSGTVTLTHPVAFKANLSQTAGAITPAGFHVRVDSAFTLTGGAFQMQNVADTLDVAGATSWNGSTALGQLTAGTLILRGNFSEPSGATVFSATGTHRTVFAGTAPQSVTFGAQGLAGNHFQDLVISNATGVNFANGGSVAGNATVSGGLITSSAGQVLTVNGNLADPTNVSWRPEITSLTGTPAVLPDSFTRNVTVSGTVTLAHPVAFKANLSQTAGAITPSGFHVRVDSAFTLTGGAFQMQNVADTLDIAGATSWNGSTALGQLTAGTLILRGNFSEPSGATVFSATGTHKTVFAGTAPQSVTFGAQGLAGNHFQDLVVSNAAGVNFANGGSVAGNASIAGGVVTSSANQVLTVNGNLTDPTNVSWRPEITSLTGTPTVLPDSLTRNVTVSGTVTLPHALAIKANLSQTAGAIAVNGFTLRVDSALTLTGGAFQMQNAADSVDIGGAASWNGATTAGLLTAGTLVFRGDFSEPSGATVFQASGTHTTVFAGSASHLVNFGAPGSAGNRFNALVLAGPGGIVLANNAFVNGTLTKAAGPAVTVGASGAARLLTVRGLALDGVVFDSVRVAKSGAATTLFNNVTFQHQDPTTTQLALVEPGTAAPVKFANVRFLTTPTTGKLVSLADTAANGQAANIGFFHSFPLDGTAFEQEVAGADGASLNWSTFAFTAQPQDAGALAILAPVSVAVRGPDAAPDTLFTGSVSLAFGANPGSATLGGTTTIAAVAGVATFSDLTVNNAGVGYTLVATTAGIAAVTSSPFTITVPLPAGFSSQWLGGTSADWNTASNWSTGTVPDSTTDVFVSGVGSFAPSVQSATGHVKRLRIATGATVNIASGDSLIADSTVEAGNTIVGSGTLILRKTGTISGQVSSQAAVLGTYAVAGTATFGFNLDIKGALDIGPDTLLVTGLLQTSGTGTLGMSDANALVGVTGPATFGGGSTTGRLTLGTLRVSGDLSAAGGAPDAFAPAGSHRTVLNGPSAQQVSFGTADSLTGSHFGILQVSTTGAALMHGHYDALGDVTITTGATLADSLKAGFTSHGFTTVDAGGTLAVNDLLLQGGLSVAVGGTYSVPTTTYGPVTGLVVNPAPYDTLVIEGSAAAGADLVVGSDLRIAGSVRPARFDVNGHAVTVNHNMAVTGDGAPVMQNAAGALNVAGNLLADGASTEGLLTAGTLQIGGDFHQAGSFNTGAFRAGAGHTTRFTGGSGVRHILFDNPGSGPTDSLHSQFGALDLPTGVDSLSGGVTALGAVTVGASVVYDTLSTSTDLTAFGALDIQAASPLFQVHQLDLHGTIALAAGPVYKVFQTNFYTGTSLPVLPYQNVGIIGPNLTLPANLTIPGSLGIGQYNEVGPSLAGDLAVNGHVLTVGTLATGGLGTFTMAPGDSVDVKGDVNFNGGNTAGHLTGGTLVGRGNFAASQTTSDSTFVAGPAHHVVLADTGAATLYVTARTEGGMQFGKLTLLDGAPRAISSFGSRLIVRDSLILGATGAGFSAPAASVWVKGPLFAATGTALTLGTLQVDSALVTSGGYNVATTIFGGTAQVVPALAYDNVTVWGTATLSDSLIIPASTLTVGGAGVPADLTMNGHKIRAANVLTTEQGVLTMTNPADTVDALVSTAFSGGNETGKLTAGVLRLHGTFTQDSTTSTASFYATATHETRFTDSAAVVQVTTSSMANGASRFNNVTITGAGAGTGVHFTTPIWVGGNVGIASPTIAPVLGTHATIGGTLTDQGPAAHAWSVDTTVFLANVTALPDSMGGSVVFQNGASLADSLRVHGFVRVPAGAFTPNGHLVRVQGPLDITGTATLVMNSANDTLLVDSTLTVGGGSNAISNLTAGDLHVGGSLLVTVPAGFWASGTHRTYLNGLGTRVVDFGAPGNIFRDFAYSDSTKLASDIAIQGGLTGPGEVPGVLLGVDSLLTLGDSVQQLVRFHAVRVRTGQTNPLRDVTFEGMDPTRTQYTMVGPGNPTPIDVSTVQFATLPTTGHFIDAIDTLANADSLVVHMLQSTPFQGGAYSAGTGEAAVRWSRLTYTTFPATVDSAVPFTIGVSVIGPDGGTYASMTPIDIALAANPAGDSLAGTLSQTATPVALFSDLVLHKPAGGVTFLASLDPGAADTTSRLDSVTSGALAVVNPAPLGAVIWDGSAGNGLWSDTMNWSTGLTPSPTDSVFIPSGDAVTFNTVGTVGGLVLGQGASLTLQGNLTVTGRVAAGNTILSGGGTLELTGTNMPVSGTLPTTRITGTVKASGPITVAGDLTIDSLGAGLDLNGHRVDVSNTLFTSNGGLLTMTAPGDSLFIASGSFAGGDETGHLTDGVLVIQGSGFDQAFGDSNSFHASGNHTTIFGNGGSAAAVNIGNPTASQFANVKVQNPNGVNFNESGLGIVRIAGNLAVSAGGVATGDTLVVGGNVSIAAPGDSVGLVRLRVGGALTMAGGYNVAITEFAGSHQTIPAAPYQELDLIGDSASLGANVVAGTVSVLDSAFTINGHTLHTGRFDLSTNGRFAMTNALDTVIVDTLASIQGGDLNGRLTAGALVVNGDLALAPFIFQASPAFLTRFASGRTHHVSTSFGVEIVGPGPFPANTFGTIQVIGDSVIVTDGGNFGVESSGDLSLLGGTWADSVVNSHVRIRGNVSADVGSSIDSRRFGLDGTLAVTTPANYKADYTTFYGAAQHIPGSLPYQRVTVEGNATLDSAIAPTFVWLQHTGQLALGGHTLTVDTSFFVNDSAHLVMHDPADTVAVAGLLTFQGANSTGDLSAGAIRAHHLYATAGTSGDHTSFVQTGSNRYLPAANDTITTDFPGPAESRFKTIDFSSAGGPVTVHGLWTTDTVIIANAASQVVADTGLQFMAGGAFVMSSGTANIPRLALQGTLDYTGGTFTVDTTVFAGFSSTQVIPSNVPYGNIAVLYNAVLADTLDLLTGGHGLVVMNTGLLDLNGHGLQVNRFETRGTGRLKMSLAADTLRAGSAFFGGGNTSGLLTDGVIQVGGFQQDGTNDVLSFAPSGTQVTEFVTIGLVAEGGYSLQMDANAGAAGSHFNRVHFLSTQGTRLFSNIYAADSLYIDNSIFGSAYSMTGAGATVIGAAAAVQLDTLRVGGTLQVDPSATYSVTNTVFAPSAAAMPAVTGYSNVIVEGPQTLTAPVTIGGSLFVQGTGVMVPNGKRLQVGGALWLTESAGLVMAAGDTTQVASAYFGGRATGTDLSGGLLRLSGSLTQYSTTSAASFAPTGTAVEFFGGVTSRSIDFQTPGTAASHFSDWRIVDTTQVLANTGLVTTGAFSVHGGSTFDASAVGAGGSIDFNGKTDILAGGTFTDAGTSGVTFHDSLNVAPSASYSVTNTIFQGTDGVPNVTYTHLYLRQGVHLTLTHPLLLTGGLNIQNPTSTGDPTDTVRLRLNGFKVNANGMYVDGKARVTMDNPNDTLEINTDVTFNGLDQDSSLSAGVIRIGGYLQQLGTNSSRSYAPAGTLTEFTGSGTHNAVFADPGTGLSHFGPLAVVNTGTLQPTTGFVVSGATTIAGGAHFDGQSVPLGNTVDFFGPVTVQSGGDFHAATSPAYFNFYDISPLTVLAGAAVPYDVLNTGFAGPGTSAMPDLPYRNLFLAGKDSIVGGSVTADSVFITDSTYVGSGGTLHANRGLVVDGGSVADLGVLEVDGGAVQADSSFTTQNAGLLVSHNASSALSVHHANFNGGSETTYLTGGQLNVSGNFASNIGTSFDADSLFIVNFAGGGNHTLFLGNPVQQHFGVLSLTASLGSDTLTLPSTTIQAYKLQASGTGLLTASPAIATLQVEGLNVNGLADSGVAIEQYSIYNQTLAFSGVTFRGFSSTAIQLKLTDNGWATPTVFNNIDFDDAAAPDLISGFFLRVEDNDGASPDVLQFQISGPDNVTGPSNSLLVGGALVTWFPPP